jgi:hypothetical protein
MSGFGLRGVSNCGDESTFNSLDCWDYSVEIELAKGAQGIHIL